MLPLYGLALTEASAEEHKFLPGDVRAHFLHVARLLEVGGPVNAQMSQRAVPLRRRSCGRCGLGDRMG